MSDDLAKRLREDVFYGDERLHNLSRHNPLHMQAADRIEELESKLAKAVETLKRYGGVMPIAFTPIQDGGYKARTTLAELTGGKDE